MSGADVEERHVAVVPRSRGFRPISRERHAAAPIEGDQQVGMQAQHTQTDLIRRVHRLHVALTGTIVGFFAPDKRSQLCA